jgi:hypothetical protein
VVLHPTASYSADFGYFNREVEVHRSKRTCIVATMVGGVLAASPALAIADPDVSDGSVANDNASCLGTGNSNAAVLPPGVVGDSVSGFNKTRDPKSSVSNGEVVRERAHAEC